MCSDKCGIIARRLNPHQVFISVPLFDCRCLRCLVQMSKKLAVGVQDVRDV